MPELARFFGIVIYIYYQDVGEHNTPHIHAKYGDAEGVYGIDGSRIISDIPLKQEKLIINFIKTFSDELENAWTLAVKGEKIQKIKGFHL
jgi:hypothetical protein